MRYGKQTCVLVVGMHRSGTSALAQTLEALGVSFGDRLLSPWHDNPKGYHEHVDIVHANQALLESFGVDADGLLHTLPVDWQYDPRTNELKDAIRSIVTKQFADAYVFGFKDPRISVLLPVYLEVLQGLGIDVRVVVSVRNVASVAASLHARNHIATEVAVPMYEHYYRTIAAQTKQVPVTYVAYDRLLTDVRGVVNELIRNVHPALRPYDDAAVQLSHTIDASLAHHTQDDTNLVLMLAREVERLKQEATQSAEARRSDFETLRQYTDVLRAQAEQFERRVADMTELVREHEQHRERAQAQYEQSVAAGASFRTRIAELEQHAAHLAQVLRDRDAHLAGLQGTIMNIERSTIWKFVKGWDTLLALVLPRDTIVRRAYDGCIRGMQFVLNDWLPHRMVLFLKRTQRPITESAEARFDAFSNAHPQVDVLFVTHDESRTGAPRIVFDVAEYVSKQQKVAFVSLKGGSMHADFEDTFGMVLYPSHAFPTDDAYTQAVKILERVRPKVVYANSIDTYQFAKAARALGIKTIFHVHELAIAFRIVFSKAELREFKTYADTFIAVSEPVRQLLVEQLGCDPAHVELVHSFVSRERVCTLADAVAPTSVREELHVTDDAPVLMVLGMFVYRKGADLFMRIAKELHDRGVRAKLVWIGSRPFKEPFMADYETYAPYFTLMHEKRNPFPYLAAADVYLLPSREDPFPLVVLEAMALGKPIVYFDDAGGIGEAVQDAGYAITDFDVSAFADAVQHILETPEDVHRRQSRSLRNQEPYDSSIMLPRIAAEIDALLEVADTV